MNVGMNVLELSRMKSWVSVWDGARLWWYLPVIHLFCNNEFRLSYVLLCCGRFIFFFRNGMLSFKIFLPWTWNRQSPVVLNWVSYVKTNRHKAAKTIYTFASAIKLAAQQEDQKRQKSLREAEALIQREQEKKARALTVQSGHMQRPAVEAPRQEMPSQPQHLQTQPPHLQTQSPNNQSQSPYMQTWVTLAPIYPNFLELFGNLRMAVFIFNWFGLDT